MSIRQELRTYILDEFPGESPTNLADDAPLRTGGVIDSLGTLNLVTFVESRFGIEVEAHEAGVENFDRIDDMIAFVERKQQG